MGWLSKGKITLAKDLTIAEAITWVETEINNNKVKDVLNRLNENYIGIRYSGWSIGAFKRDVYLIFVNNKVYVTSIAVGSGDEASSFHYFMNKSQTQKLINELNSK